MNTVFLIDGFNFYHSIRKLPCQFHWLNYRTYCEHFLHKDDCAKRIFLFTALAEWKKDGAANRHRVLLEAEKIYDVTIVLGKFKEKSGYCPKCKETSIHHEEKYTDVNIALTAYREAAKPDVDQIILITGDTDLVPAILAVKEDFPEKKVGIIFPFCKANDELRHVSDFSIKTSKEWLSQCVMPLVLTKANGAQITCPKEWIPKRD